MTVHKLELEPARLAAMAAHEAELNRRRHTQEVVRQQRERCA